MRINVLHHASCFDGAASSAIFTAFYRRCISSASHFVYIPKQHCQGDPYAASDFAADEVAVLDFRYTKADALVWFFDHHKSAFQLDGEREHFERDRSGRKFHDAAAPSCTGFIARVAQETFGFDPSKHHELLHWAELIDSAAFPSPHMPVALKEPALQLMTFVENNRDPDRVSAFINDLLEQPLAKLATAGYIDEVLRPALSRHQDDIELIRSRCTVARDVVEYRLLDQPPHSYNKFIPYFVVPKAKYVVGLSNGLDGRIKLTAGYNPWLPARAREFDVAALCERFGGGGHPFVGGVSFDPDANEAALAAQATILAVLRGEAAP